MTSLLTPTIVSQSCPGSSCLDLIPAKGKPDVTPGELHWAHMASSAALDTLVYLLYLGGENLGAAEWLINNLRDVVKGKG